MNVRRKKLDADPCRKSRHTRSGRYFWFIAGVDGNNTQGQSFKPDPLKPQIYKFLRKLFCRGETP